MDDVSAYALRYAAGVKAAREGSFDETRIGDEAYVTGVADQRERMLGERVTHARDGQAHPPPVI